MKRMFITAALTALAITGLCAFGGCKQTGSLQTATTPAGGDAPALVELNTNTGLVTIDGVLLDTNTVAAFIQTKATLAAEIAITVDSNAVPYIEAWDAVLATSLANNQYDPAQLSAALNSISVNEIKNSAYVKIGILTVVNDYGTICTALKGRGILDTSPYLRPALQAMRDGNAAALPAK